MPCRYITFSVPYKSDNFRVKAKVEKSFEKKMTRRIFPVQKPISTAETNDAGFTMPDSAVYGKDAFCLDTIAKVIGEGYMHGDNHFVTVEVAVANYNPKTCVLNLFTSVAVELEYDEAGSSMALTPISRNNQTLAVAEREQVKLSVVNASQVDGFASHDIESRSAVSPDGNIGFIGDSLLQTLPIDSLQQYDRKYAELASSNEFEYNIITSESLLPAFKKIIALKRQRGYYAGAVTIERILAQSAFKGGDKMGQSVIADSAGCVREYLKYAFRRGTKYVLLGGNAPYCPFRYGYSDSYRKDYKPLPSDSVGCDEFIGHKVPSDLYFNNLTTNWNVDGDEFYGEYGVAKFDYSPQLYVGRLLAKSQEEVNNYSDKLMKYELLPDSNADYSGYGKMLGSQCSIDYRYNDNTYTNILIKNLANWGIFNERKLMSQEGADNPTGGDIISEASAGKYGMLSFNVHGTPMTFSVTNLRPIGNVVLAEKGKYPYKRDWYSIADGDNGLDCLKNKDNPCVLYSIACTTMPYDIFQQFHYSPFKFNAGMNLGESFTLGKNYGGVAFLGNTRSGYFRSSNSLELSFYRQIHNGCYNVGICESLSKYNTLNPSDYCDAHIGLAHNLLGDPELELRTAAPESFSGITITRTDNSITVSGVGVDGATVAYCGNYMQGRAVAASGSVTFNDVSPNSSIMVYRHDYKPYIAPLVIQNGNIYNSQYVFASSFTAGRDVDPTRTQGNVTFKKGAVYEVEATGDVTIGNGVVIEEGATLKITTPGNVRLSGVEVLSGGMLILQANHVLIPQNFSAKMGGNVKLRNLMSNYDFVGLQKTIFI